MLAYQIIPKCGMLWVELYIMAAPFYPHTIDNSGWLKYYSHIFDYVEIDSSFYRIPSPSWPRIGPKEVVRISDSQPNFLKSSLMIKD
jgi:dihydrodipicolinate synthase/N-acetylneuraminate lyase